MKIVWRILSELGKCFILRLVISRFENSWLGMARFGLRDESMAQRLPGQSKLPGHPARTYSWHCSQR